MSAETSGKRRERVCAGMHERKKEKERPSIRKRDKGRENAYWLMSTGVLSVND